MAGSNDARELDIADNLERLTIQNKDAVSAADIKELLLQVRKQCEIPGKKLCVSNHLLYKLALFREHLYATILPIGDIHRSIFRDSKGMHDAELLRTRIGKALWSNYLAMV